MIRTRFLPALAFLGLLSCNNLHNRIALISTEFADEIRPMQNLEFTFNHNLVADSMFGHWIDDDLISFDPPVPGKFRFTSSDKLVFSPASAFPESTVFTAKISEDLYKYTDLKLPLDNGTLTFHTPLLDLKSVNLYWTRDETDNSVLLNADLHFSASVDPALLRDKLTVNEGNRQLPFKILTASAGQTVSIALHTTDPDTQEGRISLRIDKGMGSPGGNWFSTEIMKLDENIPEIENVEVRSMEASHDGIIGKIIIVTNQQIANTKPEECITIKPSVQFTVEKSNNGLVISSGDFNAVQTYTVTLNDKLYGVAGGKMIDSYTQTITFGELKPMIRFASSDKRYLDKNGNRNIAVQIVNVPEVRVEVIKIFENNILSFLRNGLGYNYYDEWDDEDYYDYYGYNDVNTDEYGSVVFEKKYDTKNLEKLNSASILHLDFIDKLNHFDGFYVVRVSSTEKRWLSDFKVVSLSDIGLISRACDDEVMVFANSIRTAEPEPGVKVSFISSNNQKLYTATTDNDGVARFGNIRKNDPGFTVNLVTAKKGEDFNFLPFSNTEESSSRFDVGGKRMNASEMDAFLYAERDLYRPGETMHISTVIRDYDWQTISRIPVKFSILTPEDKQAVNMRKTLDAQGACEAEWNIPQTASTGTYTVELYTSNDVLLATKYISVEEFLPDRIHVQTTLNTNLCAPGDKLNTAIRADNLYGTPASGRNWQSELQFTRETFYADKYPDYSFYISGDEDKYLPEINTQGTTSATGTAEADFTVPQEYTNLGMLNARVLTTVFDESGRPVYSVNTCRIRTQSALFGIGDFDSYIGTRTAIKIPLIAVDEDQNLVQDVVARVQIIKHEYNTVIESSGNYYTYRSNEYERIMYSDLIHVHGEQSSFTYVPETSGSYEVRISFPGASTYVSHYFYCYVWGSTESNAFKVNSEGNINIVADKKQYQTGDYANFIFTAPFNGKMLVTVERNKVLTYYYLQTEHKSASLKLRITEDHVPNIYVTATLFRPNDNSGLPLTVAHGIINVKVDDPSRNLKVTVQHEQHSRSGKKQTIRIHTDPGAQLTVAVVDEGILQVKNYTSPDPYKWFYMQRALGVSAYDLYAFLYPEIYVKSLLSGGDAGENEARLNPLKANRANLVSYWSGILHSDGSGNAKFTIDIPHFSGDLRVMVVAYKGDRFGSSETHMKVADPLVVTTSLPRFLSPADTILVPVTLANTTDKDATGSLHISLQGPLQMAGPATQSFTVSASGETRALFRVCAAQEAGTAKIEVDADAMQETFSDNTELAVRPAAGLEKTSGYGYADAAHPATFSTANNYISAFAKSQLLISRSPIIQFSEDLDYLVQYPYGCIEQITSAAFPQLYYADMVKLLYGKDSTDINPDYNVREALKILQGAQLYNGALSYWPGEGYESWWGTVYAANFFVEAKKAGFDVDENTLDKMFGYMQSMLGRKNTFTYYYNGKMQKEMADKEIFYSLYVLALAGKPDIAVMNYYKANLSMVPLDCKYMLASAYALAGDKKSYGQILPSEFSGEESDPVFGGSFYSPVRDRAIALNCLLEADPDNPQTGIMAQQLSEMMKSKTWLNTQERAFAFLAFGKLSKHLKDSQATAGVFADGREITEFNGKNIVLHSSDILGKTITIRPSGTGRIYYSWISEGIPKENSTRTEDNFLKVRKYFFDRTGKPVDLQNVHQNDLIVVKISLVSAMGTSVENVVISDLLPAGFEIENERIRESNAIDWIKDASVPDHEDIRDDRINLFVTAVPDVKNYYYMVRAVSPGIYRMGPVSADAMYNGEYHSYSGAGTVQVKR